LRWGMWMWVVFGVYEGGGGGVLYPGGI